MYLKRGATVHLGLSSSVKQNKHGMKTQMMLILSHFINIPMVIGMLVETKRRQVAHKFQKVSHLYIT